MLFDVIEWDDANFEHATRRATAAEIEQSIGNADRLTRSRTHPDRVLFRASTDGGRHLVVVAQLTGSGRLRPITAWEDR